MILIDTTVWIRALGGKQPETEMLASALLGGHVLAHELVHGELLIGDNGGRAELLKDYVALTFCPMVPHQEVVALVRAKRLGARGLSWIDIHLLASALIARARLYTTDARLAETAAECGVLFKAP